MIEPNIGRLVAEATYMATLGTLTKEDGEEVSQREREITQRAGDDLYKAIEGFDLKATDRALSRLLGNIEATEVLPNRLLKKLIDDLLLRMRDELEMTQCFVLEPNKERYFRPDSPLFGRDVATLYPSAYLEIEEAGKCLALGRSTATVFHLMRTVEVGIRAVAGGLGIPDPVKPAERNWSVILRRVGEAIQNKKSWRPRSDKEFYEEVLATLDAIRNPWRNATMHVEKTYTEDEAENILMAVRGFMMKIAGKIDENGKRVGQRSKASRQSSE